MHLTTFWAPTKSHSSSKVSDHLQSVTDCYCDVFGIIWNDRFIYLLWHWSLKVRQFTVKMTCKPIHLYLVDELSFSYSLKLLLWIDWESYAQLPSGGIFTVLMINMSWSLWLEVYYASTSAPTWSSSITSYCWKGLRQYVEGMQRVSVHWQRECGWIEYRSKHRKAKTPNTKKPKTKTPNDQNTENIHSKAYVFIHVHCAIVSQIVNAKSWVSSPNRVRIQPFSPPPADYRLYRACVKWSSRYR